MLVLQFILVNLPTPLIPLSESQLKRYGGKCQVLCVLIPLDFHLFSGSNVFRLTDLVYFLPFFFFAFQVELLVAHLDRYSDPERANMISSANFGRSQTASISKLAPLLSHKPR